MVQDSFLFWSDATCSGEGSMLEHTAVLGEEPLETIFFYTMQEAISGKFPIGCSRILRKFPCLGTMNRVKIAQVILQ